MYSDFIGIETLTKITPYNLNIPIHLSRQKDHGGQTGANLKVKHISTGVWTAVRMAAV